MSVLVKIIGFMVGAPIGIWLALYMVIAGNGRKGIGRAIVIIELPVMLVARCIFGPVGIGLYTILHLGFWFLCGGLSGLGIAVLLCKLAGID